MSRTLQLLRHAKSSWPPDVSDFDRPLAPRGEAACRAVGRFIEANGLVPDRVVTSPALRAVQTSRLVLDSAGSTQPVVEDQRLYGPPSGTINEVIAAIPADSNRPMIVGHEPELVRLVEDLTGAFVRMPTGCLVIIELETPWSIVAPGAGTLRLVLPSRVLDGLA